MAAEEEGEGEGVEGEILEGFGGLKADGLKEAIPGGLGQVVVWKCDAVGAVPYPVHEAQGGVIEFIRGQVVFDKDEVAADAAGIAQNFFGLGGVMKDVDEHAAVESIIGEGEMNTIEEAARNLTSWTSVSFNAFDLETGDASFQAGGKVAIATTYVEELTVGRNEGREGVGEDGDATRVNYAAMNGTDQLSACARSGGRARGGCWRCRFLG